MTKWRWDGRAEEEFRSACADSAVGRELAGEIATALELLRSGRPGVAVNSHGRIKTLPIHTESPWCILFGRLRDGLLIGLHLASCSHRNLPEAAFAIAHTRLDEPDL
jgi:hypothetical protein